MRATIASPTSEVERLASPRSAMSAATARCTFAAGVCETQVVEEQRDGEDRGCRVGDSLPGDVGCRAVNRLEHAREPAVGVDVARGRQADAAADRAGQIGEDVAEEVVRDDDIESSRIGHQEDRRGVDVQVIDRDIGILGGDGVDRALPERTREDEHVRLVHEREALPRASGCRVERVAHHALDPVGGVHGDLVRDLGGRADADRAAVADVGALGALTDDDEVDLARVGERARDARMQHRRAEVHVVVELEAELEQEPALDVRARETRVARHSADGSEQDRVVLLDRLEVVVGQHVARLEVACGAERERRLREGDLRSGDRRVEGFQRLGDDLWTDAVARNHREPDRTYHEFSFVRQPSQRTVWPS